MNIHFEPTLKVDVLHGQILDYLTRLDLEME